MKNFFSFFTLLFCFSLTFITCKEENFHDGISGAATETVNQPATGRAGEITPLAFEASLNAQFASKQYRKEVTVYEEISFSAAEGVTEAQQTEVFGLVQNMITQKQGQNPYYIDVNIKENKIILAFAAEKAEGPNMNDTLHGVEGCTTFPARLAKARNCTIERFPGAANLRPNGGIPQVFCSTGIFCDNNSDALCGGLGRIAKVFKGNIPQPDNFYYFTNIMEIDLLGWNTTIITGSVPDGVIEKRTPNLWYRDEPGIQHPLCISNVEMNPYYCQIWTEVLSVLPPDYYVIDVRFAKFDEHFGGVAGHHWYIKLRVGKAVQCCDCCC